MTDHFKSDALIAQLHAEIVKIWRLMALTAGDDEMNRRLDELAEMTRCLAQAPARTLYELEIKISVLCARLREEMRPEVRGEVLTWMLADSIRHDCHLIAPTRGQSAGQ
ncbi:MAG: hypothetical protein AB7P12_13185 [Alphaproteobacteria bacterium]